MMKNDDDFENSKEDKTEESLLLLNYFDIRISVVFESLV
jgi:hypothetical protein